MQRILGVCAVMALCLLAASSASATPGWYPCPGGGEAPLGAICCPNYKWCPGGHICTKEGEGGKPGMPCLRQSDPRVCRNGTYCNPGEYCGADNRCHRQ